MTGRPQPHLRTVAGDLAAHVVLLRRPEQVETLAELLEDASQRARGRGFLTVTGRFDGVEVSLLSVGLGGPSVSIAVEEAVAVGARELVLVETLLVAGGGPTGRNLLVTAAAREDGTSRQYFPPGMPAVADLGLVRRAHAAAAALEVPIDRGQVRTVDRLYGAPPRRLPGGERDPRCVDMCVGLLYPLSQARGAAAVCLGRAVGLEEFARGLDGEALSSLGRLALRTLVPVEDAA